MKKLLLIIMILVMSVAYAEEKSELDVPFNNWVNAVASGNIKNINVLYTKNAVLVFSNGYVASTTADIESATNKLLLNKNNIKQISSISRVNGDVGIRIGTFEVTQVNEKGKTKKYMQKYTMTFVKDEKKSWKIMSIVIANAKSKQNDNTKQPRSF